MTKQTNCGFSLIEVLIAMLVVAVGILGVMGLQAISLQQNRNTLLRDQALHAGNDILERMRANPAADYAPVAITAGPVAAINCISASAICQPAEMARFDITQWQCQINPFDDKGEVWPACSSLEITQADLPEGKGAIFQEPSGIHVVTVQWVRDRKGNTSRIMLRTRTGQVP